MRKNNYKSIFNKFSKPSKWHRTFAMVFMFYGLIYLSWLLFNINNKYLFIGLLFFVVQVVNYVSVSISMFNHWNMRFRTKTLTKLKKAPEIAVLVPIYKEPLEIVSKTLESILEIEYNEKVVVIVSNDYRDSNYVKALNKYISKLKFPKNFTLILNTTSPHRDSKAGNLNQAVSYLRKNHPRIDFVLVQDADEIVYPKIIDKLIRYFKNPNVAFVQSIKQVKVPRSDPFGNRDYMFYARTAPARDWSNSMFACGSGVIWRLSSIDSIGGFSTWNLVEDLTTSYELLAKGWESRYHFEPLSRGLAPEDLPNFIKQRGTWALDTMRLFFWKNPLTKKGLSFRQKMHFLEIPLFYINSVSNMGLVLVTSLSLLYESWPTRASAIEHAVMLLPGFAALEIYYLLLAGKSIPFYRTRQFWIGLSPVYLVAIVKALIYGPNNKPTYKVTSKTNIYSNYLVLALPQIFIIGTVGLSVIKSIFVTPIYSEFDWATFFWGLYMASFFLQFIKVSVWKWRYSVDFSLGTHKKVRLSYAPDIL